MAKGKTKSDSGFQVRTVKSRADRSRPSVFMRLKAEESFRGIALFEPDPEAKNNPGYFEYYDHYDKPGNTYVPCTGNKCPFCAANDNPSTRALTVWYFPEADAKDQIKIFTMNYGTINDITDESDEESGILGKKVRIKRMDDRGSYKVKILTDKPLTKKQIEKLMKQLEELFPNGLKGIVDGQLKKQMQRLSAMDAMDDDEDDDDDEPKSKSKKGKPVVADDDEEEEEEEEEESDDDEEEEEEEEEAETVTAEIEEETFEIQKVSKKNNSITVEHEDENIELVADEDEISVGDFKKGQSVTVSATYDGEEETWTLTALADSEAEEEEEEEEGVAALEDVEYEVVKVAEKDETLDLKNDDGKVKMWVGDGVDPDYDEIKKGTRVTISAEPDDEGDLVITALEVVEEKKSRGKTKGKAKAGKK